MISHGAPCQAPARAYDPRVTSKFQEGSFHKSNKQPSSQRLPPSFHSLYTGDPFSKPRTRALPTLTRRNGTARRTRVRYPPLARVRQAPPEQWSSNTTAIRIVEHEIHDALNARLDSLQVLRELGPPDLVHLTKSHGPKSGVKEVPAPPSTNYPSRHRAHRCRLEPIIMSPVSTPLRQLHSPHTSTP